MSWFLGQHRGRRIVSHGGGDTGYITDLVLLPEARRRPSPGWRTSTGSARARSRARPSTPRSDSRPSPSCPNARPAASSSPRTASERLDAALAQYAEIKANQADLYELGDDDLNRLGYAVLGDKKTEDALRVFRMNVEAFPKSANAQDSLGEACEIAGDTGAARAAYEAALRLDPTFQHAADALKKLR